VSHGSGTRVTLFLSYSWVICIDFSDGWGIFFKFWMRICLKMRSRRGYPLDPAGFVPGLAAGGMGFRFLCELRAATMNGSPPVSSHSAGGRQGEEEKSRRGKPFFFFYSKFRIPSCAGKAANFDGVGGRVRVVE
jgi:hypothetical protein